jgi:hypothetical protein
MQQAGTTMCLARTTDCMMHESEVGEWHTVTSVMEFIDVFTTATLGML